METPDERSVTDLLDSAGVDRRSYLQLLGSTALAGSLAGVARGGGDGPQDCLSLLAAIAGEDGTVGDDELLEAIEHWRADTEVPGTCGKTVDDETLLELIEVWRTGDQVDIGPNLDESVYVDAENGSDDNPGTEAEPFETIQKAMDKAADYKQDGRTVYVKIEPGTYRESVKFAYSNWDDNSTDAHVLVEGSGAESTVIKGSEIFEGWQSLGDDRFSHEWTKDWGVSPDPTDGYITDCEENPKYCADEPDLVLRREMVFVDGQRMRQVLSADAMEPGTYYVDDSAQKIYLEPPTDVTLSEATVEVSTRSRGWYTKQENNLTIRNLGVEQVATPWHGDGTEGAIVLDGDDIRVEDVRAVDNNYHGLSVRSGKRISRNMTLKNVTLDRNGGSGLGEYEVAGLLVEDCQVNENNWRGGLGGYTLWSLGNKFFRAHDVTIRRTSFKHNQCQGLWLDTDIKNVLLEDVELHGNLEDNLFLEKLQGPVTLRRVVSTGSEEGYGLRFANAENVTVEDSKFVDNYKGGIFITGDESGRNPFDDFETGEEIEVSIGDLSLQNSVISGVEGPVKSGSCCSRGNFLIGTTHSDDTWPDFVDDSYEADDNTWYDSDQQEAFEWHNDELITFETWQDRTGQDQNSVWQSSADADVSGR